MKGVAIKYLWYLVLLLVFIGENMNYGINQLDRINRQIEELNNLKMQMQQPAPINNYINTIPKIEFEAKILLDNQTIEDTIVQNKTLFVDEKNKKISIKEVDGTISKTYEIVVPKSKEELRIEELENQIKQMEVKLNEYSKSNGAIKQSNKQDRSINGNDDARTKTNNG